MRRLGVSAETPRRSVIRSLGFAYGAAVSGLVLFWVVDRRTGYAEMVRGLLSEVEAVVDGRVADALASGYTWWLVAMAALSVLTVPAALALAKGWDPRGKLAGGTGPAEERR